MDTGFIALRSTVPTRAGDTGEAWHRRSRRTHGFSLVEVLISVAILSFGLLGMVGMQAVALQGSRDARLQSDAVSLARELAEMLRGNKDVALLASGTPYLGSFMSPLASSSVSHCLDAGAPACANTSAVASAEMTEWLARVDDALPGARVTVCIDAQPYDAGGLPRWSCVPGDPGAPVSIKIGWTRRSTDTSASNTSPFDRATRPAIILAFTPGSTS
jgi:type IV pilus assembly protein PilV